MWLILEGLGADKMGLLEAWPISCYFTPALPAPQQAPEQGRTPSCIPEQVPKLDPWWEPESREPG